VKMLAQSLRPKQQIKNGAIFIGAFASGNVSNTDMLIRVLLLVVFWVFLSGSIYLLNDISDFEHDRHHPIKKSRPIASGRLPIKRGLIASIVLLCVGCIGLYRLSVTSLLLGLFYLSINIAYSFWLKNVAVVDLVIISCGFVIRGVSGVFIVHAQPTVWFSLLAIFGSLLMLGGKRLAQRSEASEDLKSTRLNVRSYNSNFLYQLQSISSGGLIMSYIMMAQNRVTFSTFSRIFLEISIIPFLATIVYILYYQNTDNESDVASLLVTRKPLLISEIIWFLTFSVSVLS